MATQNVNKTTQKKINELATRLERLERAVRADDSMGRGRGGGRGGVHDSNGANQFCALPEVPERIFGPNVSRAREELIRYVEKKWVNGTKLHYYFFDAGPYAGAAAQVDMVKQGFDVWADLNLGIAFEEVANITDAEIRIGFLQGDGAWSYVGRDVIDIPGQFERTMNFGWDLTQDRRGVDVPVHEIGHTLGFPHEHQNPFSGIEWDEEAVYSHFGKPPNNWPRSRTFHNVLRKLPVSAVEGSDWDPDSVMHYSFPADLIVSPEEYRDGIQPELGLSETDIAEVRRFYPPLGDGSNPRLEPFRSELLSLGPAEQKNFTICPPETREYTIQTFGQSDCVMVLFEDQDGGYVYLAGDDDSGTDLNAKLQVWLDSEKEYVLRLRLYLNYASGDTAVLLW